MWFVVYLLIKNHEVVYVGQTSNFYSRILQHKDKDYDRYHVFECHPHHMNDFEEGLIERFQPKYNRTTHAPYSPDRRDYELRRAIINVKWEIEELKKQIELEEQQI